MIAADVDWWSRAATIADSIASLGALGALIIAIITLRRQIDDGRRAQAAQVSAYVTRLGSGSKEYDEVQLVVDNSSGHPIYGVALWVGEYLLPASRRSDFVNLGKVDPERTHRSMSHFFFMAKWKGRKIYFQARSYYVSH